MHMEADEPVYVIRGGRRTEVERRFLVSFDFQRLHRGGRAAVYRVLYGRRVQVHGRTYRYPGLLHEGARRLGQSVFAMDEGQANRLVAMLRKHRVPHTEWKAFLPR